MAEIARLGDALDIEAECPAIIHTLRRQSGF
jgi:hypothetical protein